MLPYQELSWKSDKPLAFLAYQETPGSENTSAIFLCGSNNLIDDNQILQHKLWFLFFFAASL